MHLLCQVGISSCHRCSGHDVGKDMDQAQAIGFLVSKCQRSGVEEICLLLLQGAHIDFSVSVVSATEMQPNCSRLPHSLRSADPCAALCSEQDPAEAEMPQETMLAIPATSMSLLCFQGHACSG